MNPADDQQLPLPNMDLPLGLRLRRAREAMQLNVAQVAEKLRLRTAIVEALEREDLDALGAPVYVRGYFNSYARLVGVPALLVDRVFAGRAAPMPELHSATRVSHVRYLFDRYAKRAMYLVLTISIVGPVVFLATRDRLPRQGVTLTSLEAPLPATSTEPAVAPSTAAVEDVGPPAQLARSGDAPVMAGLGPFYPTQAAFAPVAPAPTDAALAASQGLSLHVKGDSWVEVLDAAGKRIEHGILRAGDTRRFAPGTAARVSLGNADAVEVRMNGAVTDIAAYRRANVARFTVSSDGSLAPAGG